MGLVSDPYTFANGTTADADQVNARIDALKAVVNGGIDAENIAPSTRAALGLSSAAVKRTGKAIIPAQQSVSGTTYLTLPTADAVQSIVLGTDGLLRIAYEAEWKCSVNGNGRAAIFIGSTQLKTYASPDAVVNEPKSDPVAFVWNYLGTDGRGLIGSEEMATGTGGTQPFNGIPATAHAVGRGPCVIWAPPGTYDISVKYKSAGTGAVDVRNRKLWVEAVSF